jgi:hypothetical protein
MGASKTFTRSVTPTGQAAPPHREAMGERVEGVCGSNVSIEKIYMNEP